MRLVESGFQQRYGIDYDLTLSRMVSDVSLKLMLFYAIRSKLEILKFNVKCFFQNSCLTELIFVEFPEGCKERLEKW